MADADAGNGDGAATLSDAVNGDGDGSDGSNGVGNGNDGVASGAGVTSIG